MYTCISYASTSDIQGRRFDKRTVSTISDKY
nr:MAG TPA: hypothetical protein [Siphoviridae sp. ct7ub6]